MSLLSAIDINAMGMKAQRQRVDVSTSNLAHARTTRTADGGPYRRQDVVFQSTSFAQTLDSEGWSPRGVEVVAVVDDPTDFIDSYEPGHPDADENGIVLYPNVNAMQEMANLAGASRSYQANISAISVLKTMIQRTLDLGR
jgi:flagellar basal-body rod protein FlgC